jgi:hypothetical protein
MADRDDPVAKLLERDENKGEMLRALGSAQTSLANVVAEYRDAWKAATGVGWARPDLLRAGFTDPNRLPRLGTRREEPAARGHAAFEAIASGE